MDNKLDKILKNSKKIEIDDNSKIVIMSDCHRGVGDNLDNFVKNQNIYLAALRHYYDNGFTYIELGDGDEMWEVKNYKDIIDVHLDVFKELKKFHDTGRLIMIYGNHDIVKKDSNIVRDNFYKYYNKIANKEEYLLEGIVVPESLVLNYKGYDIFLIHGHQVDFINSTLWRFSRFLVRNLWINFEKVGIKAPMGGAKKYKITKRIEKRLNGWSIKNNKILIAGHTHRAIFPKIGESRYFNDGSCIHSNGITCLEIEKGRIFLFKWEFGINKNNLFSVRKKFLQVMNLLLIFFNNYNI